MSGVVDGRYTDPETKRSRVVISWEVIGGEVADQIVKTVREVWADDPDDLSSPLHVTWDVVHEKPDPEVRELEEATPATRRVHAILKAASGPLTVARIGDELAREGRPLKVRTIQTALKALGPLAEATVIDPSGTQEWVLRRLPNAMQEQPDRELWYEGETR